MIFVLNATQLQFCNGRLVMDIKRFVVAGKLELELTPGSWQVLQEDEFKARPPGHGYAVRF